MSTRKRLSAVLLESELVTAEDVERALDHQRTHGGYFGQALVELGLVRPEEVEWALASQLDLPFIFPDPELADAEATRLVPPDWALAHLAVPFVRAGESVTMVVADPLDGEVVDELRERTGLEVEMALATPERIRELIRAVYGDCGAAPAVVPVGPLGELVAEALARGAERIGVSARGGRALGWYAVGEETERRWLEDGWGAALEALLDPAPSAAEREGSAGPYEATLRQPGGDVAVEVRAAGSLSGTEVLLRPRRSRAASSDPGLDVGLLADLRLLAAGETARIGVAGASRHVDEALPRLPSLVLGEESRTAHVAEDADIPGVYTLAAREGQELAVLLEALSFDGLSVDLPLDDPRLPDLLAAAPLSFARVPDIAGADALERAGLRWLLTVSGDDQDGPAWELRPTDR